MALVALLGSIEELIGQGLAERAEAVLLDLFRSILTEDAGDALAGVRRLFEEERPGLLTLGVASTLLALVRAVSTVFRALDVVYEVRLPRLWWQRRARALALSAVTVIVAARSSRVFGVLGGALILLLWLYLLALGLLFGGELNAALGGRGSRTSRTAVVT